MNEFIKKIIPVTLALSMFVGTSAFASTPTDTSAQTDTSISTDSDTVTDTNTATDSDIAEDTDTTTDSDIAKDTDTTTDSDIAEDTDTTTDSDATEDTDTTTPNFPDMPDDWTTEALEKAVENGLLSGFDDGTIRPDDNITRAQMATIVVRSFGATTDADISKFTDVNENDWFYSYFSKAVQMGAFNGNDLNQLNPNNPIKFEECFKVIACVFGLIADTKTYAENSKYKNDLQMQDLTVLDKFSDGNDVSEWAKPYVASIISGGYWDGIDGKLTPTEYITRAQFAVLMDNIVKTYITEPGIYTDLGEGNIMIKAPSVTIDKLTTDDNVIISDGVSETEEGINFTNCTFNGRLVVRGGGENVTFQGYLKDFVVQNPGILIYVDLSKENLDSVTGYVIKGSRWSYTFGS